MMKTQKEAQPKKSKYQRETEEILKETKAMIENETAIHADKPQLQEGLEMITIDLLAIQMYLIRRDKEGIDETLNHLKDYMATIDDNLRNETNENFSTQIKTIETAIKDFIEYYKAEDIITYVDHETSSGTSYYHPNRTIEYATPDTSPEQEKQDRIYCPHFQNRLS